MNKYDKYLEKGRLKLNDYVSRLKSLNEKIESKENDKAQLGIELYDLQCEIKTLEQKLGILETAPKVKKKEMLRELFIYGGISGLFLLMLNLLNPSIENISFDILIVFIASIAGKYSYESYIEDIRNVEKEYTIDSLKEEKDNKKLTLSRKKDEHKTISSELDKLYEEKDALKNIICDLNKVLIELGNQRLAAMEQNLVPSIESLLDEDFAEIYGENDPLDVGSRIRENTNI